jgi:DNA-binding transcriptional LysR family regulator
MKIETLNEFVALIKHKNYSSAAKELYCSQPTLSNHMAQLEKELGFKLLTRQGSRLSLTPAGSEFLKSSQAIISLYDKALKTCQNITKKTLPVRIQSITTDSERYRNSGAYQKLKRTRDIPFVFIDADFDTTVFKALEENLIDIGFDQDFTNVAPLADAARALGLAWVPLGKSPLALCVMKTNSLAKKQRLSRNDLRGVTISIQNGQHFDRWKLFLLALFGADLDLEFVLDPIDSISDISLADFGETVHICSRELIVDHLSHRDDVVIYTELADLRLEMGYALVYRASDDDSNITALAKRLTASIRRA